MSLRQIIIALLLVGCISACQRQKKPVGDAVAPSDAPAYTVQSNLNGGVAPVTEEKK